MTDLESWNAVAILPNLSLAGSLEGGAVALASTHDNRTKAACVREPLLGELLSQFTNAFGRPVHPTVLIARHKALETLSRNQAFQSFRDLTALSVIPFARAMGIVYPNSNRIVYSDTFWLYPWMLGKDGQSLVCSTPALLGYHVVNEFAGQSSPEVPLMELSTRDVDRPIFDALVERWNEHFIRNRKRRGNRVLFRSLNMAAHAARIPAGVDARFWDFGRNAALWVSAFEILAPAKREGFREVYALLERVRYNYSEVRRRSYLVHGERNLSQRRPLPCWLYGKLHKARIDFIHGNPITHKTLKPTQLKTDLHWLAAVLYRVALSGYLRLPSKSGREFLEPSEIIERALLRSIK